MSKKRRNESPAFKALKGGIVEKSDLIEKLQGLMFCHNLKSSHHYGMK